MRLPCSDTARQRSRILAIKSWCSRAHISSMRCAHAGRTGFRLRVKQAGEEEIRIAMWKVHPSGIACFAGNKIACKKSVEKKNILGGVCRSG
jgi:hypothetical protein